ncbi:hypothetical protein BH09ACT12_BH09ACT12_17060 [soil metagenome]
MKSAAARPLLVRTRLLAPLVALALAGVVVLPGFTTPASAATGSISDLQTALTTCTDRTTIALTQDLSDTAAALEVACDTTIDLAGHDLDVQNIVIDDAKTLTVTDTTPVADAGTLTADASSAYGTAGIRTTNAALTTSGTASITATGGRQAAGIGGDPGASGGATTSSDSSTVTATGGQLAAGIGGGRSAAGGTTISSDSSSMTATGGEAAAGIGGGDDGGGGTTTSNDSSTMTATGGVNAAGIGGGDFQAGGTTTSNDSSTMTATGGVGAAGVGGGIFGAAGTTTISGGSTIIARSGSDASAVGFGQYGPSAGATFLDVTDGTLRLPGGSTLDVPAGLDPQVTIGTDGIITGTDEATPTYGTITGSGEITNDGAITLPTTKVDPTLVTHHHYAVSFDTDGGSTAPDPATVFADTFTHGDRALPAAPTKTGYVFTGWNTEADGTGTDIEAGTVLPGSSSDGTAQPIALYALYHATTDSISHLQNALTTCADPTAITLTQDLTGTAATLEVACDTTIDLAGYDLTVQNVVIDDDKTLIVTDATPVADAGTLTADASGVDDLAGIQTTDAALTTSGTARVTATAGRYGAGIGGGNGFAGGTTTSEDTASITAIGGHASSGIGGGYQGAGGTTTSDDASTITATGGTYGAGIGGGWSTGGGGTTTSNDSSSITAVGGEYASGIGGGDDGGGGITTSNDSSTMTATGGTGGAGVGGGFYGAGAGMTTISGGSTLIASSPDESAVGVGLNGTPTVGTFLDVADGTLRLPGDSTLDLPGGLDPRVTIGADGLITGTDEATPTYGTITGSGEITNDGAITLPTTKVDPTLVAHHHYAVSFDTDGGSTTPDPATVFADTFTHGDRALPAAPTRTGYTFEGWFTQSDGAGTRISDTSTLPGTSSDGTSVAITAHASWAQVPITLPPMTPIQVSTPVITNTTSGSDGTAVPVVDEVLSVTVGETAPAGATLSYQWTRTDGDGADTAIPSAHDATYTLVQEDVDTRISVTVTATPTPTMGWYTVGRSTSEPTGPVAVAPDSTFADPSLVVRGKSRVGGTLTGTITRPDITGLAVTWQWQQFRFATATATDIADAAGPAYTPTPGQVGDQLRLVVTLTAPGYTTLTVHGDPQPVRAGHLARPGSRIRGTARPGRRLVAKTKDLAGLPAGYDLTYRWRIDGHRIKHRGGHRVYRPRRGQVGSRLTVTVIATAPGYAARLSESRERVIRPRRH